MHLEIVSIINFKQVVPRYVNRVCQEREREREKAEK